MCAAVSDPPLIAGRFVVDLEQPASGAGGGLDAFIATDKTGVLGSLIALKVHRRFPARAQALHALSTPVDGILNPIARGTGFTRNGEGALFLIAQAPPGPPIGGAVRAWGEAELLDRVLRPAARTLDRLAGRGLTHRAIRPDNVYIVPGGVMLGFAWGAPPAMHQPVLFESPASAICMPTARGEGTIADDVYSLGVLLLSLALGRVPLLGLDDREIIRRKQEVGSFEALVGGIRLPQALTDLVRGMLAEDPEHRTPPALLMEPWSARARRVATRPLRRAPKPLELGGVPAWNTPTLALSLALAPDISLRALRAGFADAWLRRSLGEPALAARLDDVVRLRTGESEDTRGNAIAAMRAVTVLDPLAPLCWRGLALWPDGLGPALASTTDKETADRLVELTELEAIGTWAGMRPDRTDTPLLRSESRRYRGWLNLGGAPGGLERLMYMLNPLQPCASPLLGGAWVSRISDLLPALERQAAQERPGPLPIDAHITAFLAARSERESEEEVSIASHATAGAQLSLLARLQTRWNTGPAPNVARWLAAAPGLITVRAKSRRARIEAKLKELAETGMLAPMMALVRDPQEMAADSREAVQAAQTLAGIEMMLNESEAARARRMDQARRWGHEVATGIGLATLAFSLAWTAFG